MDSDAAPAPEINLSDDGDLYEAASSYKPENDRHIRLLVEQFEGHLQTMHGNASILGEVPDWVWKARTSVEEVIDRVDGNLFHTMVGI